MALGNLNSPNVPVTVVWENNCKETLHEQVLSAADVFEMILTDKRAIKNRYMLPHGELVDSEDFYAWYVTSFEEVPRMQ